MASLAACSVVQLSMSRVQWFQTGVACGESTSIPDAGGVEERTVVSTRDSRSR
jgi:hypothetical protein